MRRLASSMTLVVIGAWSLTTTAPHATEETNGAARPATAPRPRELLDAGERAMTRVDAAMAALARHDRAAALDALDAAEAALNPLYSESSPDERPCLEDAYVRIVAARAKLQAGGDETAHRLLAGASLALHDLRPGARLGAVRFALHAAADAALEREWESARDWLQVADRELRRVRQTAAPPTASALMPLTIEAKTLSDRLASGNTVDPRELRKLASAVAAVQRR